MSVAYFTHRACLDHDTGIAHPENPDRLRTVWRALEHPNFVPLLREEAPEATVEQLSRAHPRNYVDKILSLRPEEGDFIQIDGDTRISHGSVTAALYAAGAGIAAVDAVMEGWARAAFCAVRPPGHHAEPAEAMGFCLFNNAVVAAQHARARWGLQRIAVVDFDVHHGNGTQHLMADDPDLFYASTHQFPCYPGTGLAEEHGVAENVVNVLLDPGSGSAAFRAAWSGQVLPALERFAPDLLVISAGFDADKRDPQAQLRVEPADFAWLTEQLMDLAERRFKGRVVSVLEGGYDLDALREGVSAHVRALMRA